jgi:hypothetical protein
MYSRGDVSSLPAKTGEEQDVPLKPTRAPLIITL